MPRCYMVKKGAPQRQGEGGTPHSPTEATVAPPCYNPVDDRAACTETESAEYSKRGMCWPRSAADTEAAHELLSLSQSVPALPPPAMVTVLSSASPDPANNIYTTYMVQPTNIYFVSEDSSQLYPQQTFISDISPQTILDLPLETDANTTDLAEHTIELAHNDGPEPGVYHVIPQVKPKHSNQRQDKNIAIAIPTPVIRHTKKEKPKYSCTQCGKKYATSSNLSRHRQTHRSLDSIAAKKCPECGKVYVSMPALAMHLLTHRMAHTCPTCGKQFSRPWLLRGHQRSHTGEKPYICASCGKSFADRSNLRAHLQTHAFHKMYECPRCNKSFALKSYLNKHFDGACVRDASDDDAE